MKKFFVFMLMAVMTLGANAQFEKGTHYVGASLSGFGIQNHHQHNVAAAAAFSWSLHFRAAEGGQTKTYKLCGQSHRRKFHREQCRARRVGGGRGQGQCCVYGVLRKV